MTGPGPGRGRKWKDKEGGRARVGWGRGAGVRGVCGAGELLRRGREVDNTLAQFEERDANFITW